MNNGDKNKLVSENGWKEYKVYLLNSIEVINDEIKNGRKELTELKISVAGIKRDITNHSKIWGAVSGVVAAVIIAIATRFIGA